MTSFWNFFALVLLESCVATAETLVTIPKSKVTYRGALQGSVEHFQNIKFAHDTYGARRFAPPVPCLPPSGTEIDASSPGPACPQIRGTMPPFYDETKDMSEDCLNLRIARPQGTAAQSQLLRALLVHEQSCCETRSLTSCQRYEG
jgi:hypothetical protein